MSSDCIFVYQAVICPTTTPPQFTKIVYDSSSRPEHPNGCAMNTDGCIDFRRIRGDTSELALLSQNLRDNGAAQDLQPMLTMPDSFVVRYSVNKVESFAKIFRYPSGSGFKGFGLPTTSTSSTITADIVDPAVTKVQRIKITSGPHKDKVYDVVLPK